MAINFKIQIGERLRSARNRLGKSLEEICMLTGRKIKKSTLGNYENGKRMPGPNEIVILAKVLKENPAYLMCIESGEMTEQEIDLLRNFRSLPQRDRDDYFRRIEALGMLYREPTPDERLKPELSYHRRTERRKSA